MTAETTITMTPSEVLEAARRFFTGTDAVHAAWIETESPTHVSFATFRSNILVSALPDPGGKSDLTLVRVSTLRDQAAVGKFLTFLETSAGTTASTETASIS